MKSNEVASGKDTHFKASISSIKSEENAFPIEQLHEIIKYQSLFYFPLLTRLFHSLLSLKKISDTPAWKGLASPRDKFKLSKNICHLFDFELKDNRKPSTAENDKKYLKKYLVIPIEKCLCKNSERSQILITDARYKRNSKSTESNEEEQNTTELKTVKRRTRVLYEVQQHPTALYDYIQEIIYKLCYEQVYKLRNYNFINDGFKHVEKDYRFVENLENELRLSTRNMDVFCDDDTDSPIYINF